MGNKSAKGKHPAGDVPDGSKGKRGSKKSRSDKDKNASCPDLGGAVPYEKNEDDSKVTVTIYRSVRDIRRHPSEIPPSRNDVNVKIYRKSTSGYPDKPQSLPRNFSRSKSATLPGGRGALTPGESHFQDFPSLRRRIDSVSTRTSNRRASKTSSMDRNSQFLIPVTVTDLPDTEVVKQKVSKFETLFVKSLVQKYCELPEDLQLQHLTVAYDRDSRGKTLSLFEYMNNDAVASVQLSNPDGRTTRYIPTVPEAMLHGTDHVRRTKIKALNNQLPLVKDLLSCVALEAAAELSRIYEYQISLMYDDMAMKILAEQAIDCVMEYAQGHCLDRNSIPRSVAFVYPPNVGGVPKVLSAVIGLKELKWNLYEIFKKPGLRKEKSLLSSEYPRELEVDLDPWTFHYQKGSEPFLYGYRGQIIEWDFYGNTYKLYEQEDTLFREEIAYQEEDLHRLYKPHKRLFGTDLMERFFKESNIEAAHSGDDDRTSVKDVMKMKAFGNFKEIDDVQPVYRPLKPHRSAIDFKAIDTRGLDMTRAKSVATGAATVPVANGNRRYQQNGTSNREKPAPYQTQNGGMNVYQNGQSNRAPIEIEYSKNFTRAGHNTMPAVREGKSSETEIN